MLESKKNLKSRLCKPRLSQKRSSKKKKEKQEKYWLPKIRNKESNLITIMNTGTNLSPLVVTKRKKLNLRHPSIHI